MSILSCFQLSVNYYLLLYEERENNKTLATSEVGYIIPQKLRRTINKYDAYSKRKVIIK